MDPEKKVELGLVLGSRQGRVWVQRKKDTEGMATVELDHSAKVVASTGQCHV